MLFKVSDLLDKLTEIKNDGFDKVELSFLEADEELPACLHFEVPEDEYMSVDYEDVDAI